MPDDNALARLVFTMPAITKYTGQNTKRWDMGFDRLAPARLQADYANSEGL